MFSKVVDMQEHDPTENLARETLLAFGLSFIQIHVLRFLTLNICPIVFQFNTTSESKLHLDFVVYVSLTWSFVSALMIALLSPFLFIANLNPN